MARSSGATPGRTPIEAALRHLGTRREGGLVELIEHAIHWPNGDDGAILEALTEPTSILDDWTLAARAEALWRVIEEGIVHPQVSSTPNSRRRRALQAAFRLPDEDLNVEWAASLTQRFKQLKALHGVFDDATSTQPMEVAWKRGVEGLAEHLEWRFKELRTPEDWARYKPVEPYVSPQGDLAAFRKPSEGAQKLLVNFALITVVLKGRAVARRTSERLITSLDSAGLRYYTTHAFSSAIGGRSYVPTRALWGCRAEQVDAGWRSITRLWFPRPLGRGEQAHFITEAVFTPVEDDDRRGWVDVVIDHYGIEPGRLFDRWLPVSGLTIRIRFDHDVLPEAVWWYAEQNEEERYAEPPPDSPRRLAIVDSDVSMTFEFPCQPRENYGIAYTWT